MDILKYNSKTWDDLTEQKDKWTVPVDATTIAEARKGNWTIHLTSIKPTFKRLKTALPGFWRRSTSTNTIGSRL